MRGGSAFCAERTEKKLPMAKKKRSDGWKKLRRVLRLASFLSALSPQRTTKQFQILDLGRSIAVRALFFQKKEM